jgi:hypothetical protein
MHDFLIRVSGVYILIGNPPPPPSPESVISRKGDETEEKGEIEVKRVK